MSKLGLYITSKSEKSVIAPVLKAALVLGLCFFTMSPRPANACGTCQGLISLIESNVWEESVENFDEKVEEEFFDVERFVLQEIWNQSILPVMMDAADQLTAVAMHQVMMVGMFIDAENQLAAQRKLQEMRAKAHKDYQPSIGMCEFGSVMKSLAATELKTEIVSAVLLQRSQDRQLGKTNTTGMYGTDLDQENRIIHFRMLFCNAQDRESALASVCTDVLWTAASFDEQERERINNDIDYVSLIESPVNLSLDFTNQDISTSTGAPLIDNRDEENILALASNLFGHELFPRAPARALLNKPQERLSIMQKAYLDMRSIVAKRSVAENSLYAIAAMKTSGYVVPSVAGPDGTTDKASARIYMEHILNELGVSDANASGDNEDEILKILGENPSYYAQMEIITKKMYQNPDFYTNLYDTPVNVERKTVALQAIKLMQKFDIMKSVLRDEATTSILLELAIVDLQTEVEDAIKAMGE